MAFEYNGVVYRDLESQVRYDAEQVELLKQADVTINENLQTINENLQTEINGKLTKPANPTAESAVTMLTDGTVGTKPLSEIGGSGKLYMHRVTFKFDSSANYTLITDIVTGTNDPITVDFLRIYIQGYGVVSFNGLDGLGTVTLNCLPSNVYICGVVANIDRTGTNIVNINTTMSGLTIDSQTVVEL